MDTQAISYAIPVLIQVYLPLTTPPTPTSDEQPQKLKTTITLPYIQCLSEPIRRLSGSMDIRVRFRANTTLRQILMRPKDPIPHEEPVGVGVVYRIPCKDCPKAYIGQSGRSLVLRLKEHKRAVHNCDTNASALVKHAWQEQHQIDWSSAEILDSEQFLSPRLLLESWFIHSEKNPLN